MSRVNYHAYLMGQDWATLRERVRQRAGNGCECMIDGVRCWQRQEHVHHKTYKNLGHEPLEDLMAVCNDCHRRIHLRPPNETLSQISQRYSCVICDTRTASTAIDVCWIDVYTKEPVCADCEKAFGRFSPETIGTLTSLLFVRRFFDEQARAARSVVA